jgi:hypothetical protein
LGLWKVTYVSGEVPAIVKLSVITVVRHVETPPELLRGSVFVIGLIWPRFPTVGQGLDLGRDLGGVVFHPAEQRRAAGVSPVQAEKVETPAIT